MKISKAAAIAAVALALALGACGGGDEEEEAAVRPPPAERPERPAVEVEPEPEPYVLRHVCDEDDFEEAVGIYREGPDYFCSAEDVAQAVDEYACGGERQAALDYGRAWLGYGSAVVEWDGTPFPVDVSSSLSDPAWLMEIVEAEAERVRMALGYEVFVPGRIVVLPDVSRGQAQGGSVSAAEGRIEIRCCLGPEDGHHAGEAFVQERLVLVRDAPTSAVHVVTHEVYHLLAFGHPEDGFGIPMSDVLMRGSRFIGVWRYLRRLGYTFTPVFSFTQPVALDLARLACVFD